MSRRRRFSASSASSGGGNNASIVSTSVVVPSPPPSSPIVTTTDSPRTVLATTRRLTSSAPSSGSTTTQKRRSYNASTLAESLRSSLHLTSGGSHSSLYYATLHVGSASINSCLGLQISDIITLLQDVIPKFAKGGGGRHNNNNNNSNNRELIALAKDHAQRLVQDPSSFGSNSGNNSISIDGSSKSSGTPPNGGGGGGGGGGGSYNGGNTGSGNRDYASQLDDIVSVLNTFVDTSPKLPPSLVATIHTTIGLIRQEQRFYISAIESLQKALWIKKSSKEPAEEIAISLHRLGLAYARCKSNSKQQRQLASEILWKAYETYVEDAHWKKNHPLVVAAYEKAERYGIIERNSPLLLLPPRSAGGTTTQRRRATTHGSSSPYSSFSPSNTSATGRRRRGSSSGGGGLASASKDWKSLPAIPNLHK